MRPQLYHCAAESLVSDTEHRVPVIEERVRIDKKLVDSGVVKISTSVSEHTEMVSAALMRERVEIERVPMSVEVDHVPDMRHEGDIIVIPVVEERAVVVKRLVLVEELHVRRKLVQENAQIPVELRATEVHVRREESSPDSVNSSALSGDAQ